MTSWQVRFSLLVALSACFVGCREKAGQTKNSNASSIASAAGYSPPPQGVGTVEGTVVIEGDPAMVIDAETQKIPADCDAARNVYPPLFREGPGRTLADAFGRRHGLPRGSLRRSKPRLSSRRRAVRSRHVRSG